MGIPGEALYTWTTEKPSKPGFYWVFDENDDEPMVYLARLDDILGNLVVYQLAWEEWLTVEDFSHFIAIPEPAPPSASN